MSNNPFIQRQMEMRKHMLSGFTGMLITEHLEVEKADEADIVKAEEGDLEKARTGRYVDSAENRKLGRVGKEYEKVNHGYSKGEVLTLTLPTGQRVQGKYQDTYGKYVSIKTASGKLYGATAENVERTGRKAKIEAAEAKRAEQLANSAATADERKAHQAKVRMQREISKLQRDRERVSLDMEEDMAQEAEQAAAKNGTDFATEMERISCDGNNPTVVHWGKELQKIDDKICKLSKKLRGDE